jgi:hypothetical protein
MTPAAQPATA